MVELLSENPQPPGMILGHIVLGQNSVIGPDLTPGQRRTEDNMERIARQLVGNDAEERADLFEARPQRSLDKPGGMEWLRRSADALEVYQPDLTDEPAGPVPDAQHVAAWITAGLKNELQGYTLEESLRLLKGHDPGITRDFFHQQVVPLLLPRVRLDVLSRDACDGPERHFLFAAHLARFMMGAEPGATEDEVVQRFLDHPQGYARQAWRELSGTLLEQGSCREAVFDRTQLGILRQIYPFIPLWEGGIKTERDYLISEKRVCSDPEANRLWRSVHESLSKLASIPMVDPLLAEAETHRANASGKQLDELMLGAHVVEVVGVFADSIPRIGTLEHRYRVRGRDITLSAKDYSGSETAIDVLARVYGVRARVLPSDGTVLGDWAMNEVAEEAKRAKGEPLIVHIEGVKNFWTRLAAFQEKNPKVKLVCVSHTTSDGRDLLESKEAQTALLTELMSMGDAKANDERERFRVTFSSLFTQLLYETRLPLLEWAHVVVGRGKIVGHAAEKAFKALELDVRVRDPRYDDQPGKQGARAAAQAEGLNLIDDLSELSGRPLVLWSCAGLRTVGEQELQGLAGGPPVMLVSLGSGEYDFDMEWIRNHATFAHVSGALGDMPIIEYTLEFPQGPLRVLAVAAGKVANLAFLHPTPGPYAATTPLLIEESMLEGVWRSRRGERGAQTQACTQIDILPSGQRLITLEPLGGGTQPLELDLAQQRFVDANPNTSFFIRSWNPEKASWSLTARTLEA